MCPGRAGLKQMNGYLGEGAGYVSDHIDFSILFVSSLKTSSVGGKLGCTE